MSSRARGAAEALGVDHESICERVHHARREFERVHSIFIFAVTFNCAGAAVNGHVAEGDFRPLVERLTYGRPMAGGTARGTRGLV